MKRRDFTEADIAEVFRGDVEIPTSVDERLKSTYETVRQSSAEKIKNQDKPATKHLKVNKILLAAAAVSVAVIAFAATAAAGMSNTEFFNSVFGSQGMDKAHYDKEYNYYWQREDVDADNVGKILNNYIINIDKTFTVEEENENSGKDTYTIHVEKAVIDTNDIGFVTYSIEGPNLSKHMGMLGENDTNICVLEDDYHTVHFFDICYASEGETQSEHFLHYHENLDVERSTENKYYIVQSFVPGDKIDNADIVLKYWLPDGDRIRGKSIDITIPKTNRYPAVTFQNTKENAYVSISPMGLADIGGQYVPKPYFNYNVVNDADTIIIKYKDGSEYTVIDCIEKDANGKEKVVVNRIFTTGEEMIFNRFVDVTEISEIVIDDITLTRAETKSSK